ncbi:MAG: hypothetical protein KQH57_10380 [Actinomycetales bacterium]|nr:hypothetical protein [Actinomycetales bacterium]
MLAAPVGLIGSVLVFRVAQSALAGAAVPGMTTPEARAWRALRATHFDPELGADAGRSQGPLAAGLVGGVLAWGVAFVILGVPVWTGALVGAAADRMLVADLLAPIAPAVLGAIGARLAFRSWLRRRWHRTREAAEAVAERDAGVCRCWDASARVGRHARRHVDRHLTVVAEHAAVRSAAGQVRLCPSTGLPWLVVDHGGRLLALPGVAALEDVQDEPAVGYYL